MALPSNKVELFEFFESIPESAWTTYELTNGAGQLCAYGHVAHKLLGIPVQRLDQYSYSVADEVSAYLRTILSVPEELQAANDGSPFNPREGVLRYLQTGEVFAA